jgi:hypothetical protein
MFAGQALHEKGSSSWCSVSRYPIGKKSDESQLKIRPIKMKNAG